MKNLVVLVLGVLAVASARGATPPDNNRPNVLVLHVDQLRIDCLGAYHHMLLKGNHMYDPLVKVPLIVKWPRQRDAGQVSERLVSNVDLAPTLCRAAGLQPADDMHGENLGGESQGREIVFCESGPNRVMARTRTHKLLFTGNAPQQTLFYDLQSDPLELHNLSGLPEAQDEIRRLTAAIAAWRPQPVSQRYVDLQAPQIRGANVPSPGLEHRQQIIDYYRAKMQAPLER